MISRSRVDLADVYVCWDFLTSSYYFLRSGILLTILSKLRRSFSISWMNHSSYYPILIKQVSSLHINNFRQIQIKLYPIVWVGDFFLHLFDRWKHEGLTFLPWDQGWLWLSISGLVYFLSWSLILRFDESLWWAVCWGLTFVLACLGVSGGLLCCNVLRIKVHLGLLIPRNPTLYSLIFQWWLYQVFSVRVWLRTGTLYHGNILNWYVKRLFIKACSMLSHQ